MMTESNRNEPQGCLVLLDATVTDCTTASSRIDLVSAVGSPEHSRDISGAISRI